VVIDVGMDRLDRVRERIGGRFARPEPPSPVIPISQVAARGAEVAGFRDPSGRDKTFRV
jgi:hypothetical protein